MNKTLNKAKVQHLVKSLTDEEMEYLLNKLAARLLVPIPPTLEKPEVTTDLGEVCYVTMNGSMFQLNTQTFVSYLHDKMQEAV